MRQIKRFETEEDVRKLVLRLSKAEGFSVFWVENKGGGTEGFPDAVLVRGPETVFAELKIGERKGEEIHFEARNAQRIVLRKIAKAGAKPVLIVGERGSRTIFVGPGDRVFVREGRKRKIKETSIWGSVGHFMQFCDVWEINDLRKPNLFRTLVSGGRIEGPIEGP